MHRVQRPELLHHEEPAQAPGAGGMEEVLPAVQQAPAAQGIEVAVATEALERLGQSWLRRAREFIWVQVPAEVRKCTWPTWEELKWVTAERKIYPGYVLVDMLKNQETLHTINGIQGVIKFVGTGREPMPLRPDEVNRLLGIEEAVKEEEPQETIPFLIGQVVEITEGPFSDFSGTVEEVIPDKGKVRVAVSLFGRPTSVELDYLQLKAH